MYQYPGEVDRKLNQYNKTTRKIKDIFSIRYDSVQLIELVFRLKNIKDKEPEESANNALRGKFIWWE